MADSAWVQKALKQMKAERTNLRIVQATVDKYLTRATSHVEDLNNLAGLIQRRLEAHDEAAKELALSRDDPEVLVRVVGPNRSVFHSAESPCGWVRNRRRYETWLWGDAVAKGYEPCSSCGYQASWRGKEAPARQTA